jgi:hypothetical protein
MYMYMVSLEKKIEGLRWEKYVAHNGYYEKHREVWRNGK